MTEAGRLRAFLSFPADVCVTALDPCAGTGKALVAITEGANGLRYGIELDSFREEEAKEILDHVVQGDCFAVHCAVESFGLLLLNPPYDFECSEGHSERTERLFLEHCFRWLQPGGVLVMVIPAQRAAACSHVLSVHFTGHRDRSSNGTGLGAIQTGGVVRHSAYRRKENALIRLQTKEIRPQYRR